MRNICHYFFDTVFTAPGSATRIFKTYNRHRESIRVSRTFLKNGTASRFSLNVGIAGDSQADIEIVPNVSAIGGSD